MERLAQLVVGRDPVARRVREQRVDSGEQVDEKRGEAVLAVGSRREGELDAAGAAGGFDLILSADIVRMVDRQRRIDLQVAVVRHRKALE